MITKLNHLQKYTCNLCDKVFKSKPEFMTHRKKNHNNVVKRCLNDRNATCSFSYETCWYNHSEDLSRQFYDDDNINKESSEVTQKK